MKVLILGSTGTLGHKLYQVLGQRCDVAGTVRGDFDEVSRYGFFKKTEIVPRVNATEIAGVKKAVDETRPDAVINGIGVVKSLSAKSGPLLDIWLNALFPHQLADLCREKEIRLIHISTDCVFSGNKGNYREDNPSDAEDIYGKTKYLGEVTSGGALTIRTSFIGRELAASCNLLEWFLSNRGGRVDGYTNAIFSGFTSLQLARIIADIVTRRKDLNGLYHISSEPISKYRLLVLINKTMRLNIDINESAEPRCDRSLDSTRYRQETGFAPLSWEQMVEELARDSEPYQKWRNR